MTDLQVRVKQGILEGKTLETRNGFQFRAFMGIPYAKPPLGELRFREPQPPENWKGVRDATIENKIFAQFDSFQHQKFMGEEDSLILNVYVPSTAKKGDALPVMLFVHGGAFLSGSGDRKTYGPDYLIEHNVIYVTVNYRLGPFGFLCLNIPEAAGNMGMKDQVMALRWINANIHQFGGDTNNITIFGESSGGACTSLLSLSPLTKNLINKVIYQSGTAISDWAIDYKPEDVAFKLGRNLGMETTDKYELLRFLQEVPAKDLVLAIPPMVFENLVPFAVVIEKVFKDTKPFISEDPREIIRAGTFHRIPNMFGFTSNEGHFHTFFLPDDVKNIEKVALENINIDFDMFVPKHLHNKLSSEQRKGITQKIKDFYFPDNIYRLQGIMDLISDAHFIRDVDFITEHIPTRVADTYYYYFDYKGKLNIMQYIMPEPYKGASHGDETGYLFSGLVEEFALLPFVEPSEKDKEIIKLLTKLWTNFAKFGNPTPHVIKELPFAWKPYSADEPWILSISDEVTLVKDLFKDKLLFWKNLQKID